MHFVATGTVEGEVVRFKHEPAEAQVAPQNSEDFLERLLAATPNLIYIYDLVESRNIYTNREVTDVLGYTSQEVIALGADLFETILHPDDAAAVAQHHARLRALAPHDDGVLELEYRMRHASGEWRWLHSRDLPFARDASGAVTQILGSTEDITDRKIALEKLGASEGRYRSIIETMSDACFRADLDGHLVEVSPSGAKMYAYDAPEDMIGLDAGVLYADIGERHAILETLRAHGVVIDRVGQGRRRTGEVFTVSINVQFARDDAGRVMGTVGFVRDISERQAAQQERTEREARLQSLLDNAPYGAHMFELQPDDNLVFIGYNQRAADTLGVDHQSLIGKNLEEAFPGNVGTESPAAYRRVAREGGTWSSEQFVYDSGEIAGVFEVYAFSFGPSQVSVFFRDITERRKLEVALKNSEERSRALIEQAADGILVWDSNGRFVEVNDRACSMLGHTHEQFLALSIPDVIGPADSAASPAQLATLTERQPVATEHVLVRGDGTTLAVEINAKMLPDGRTLAITRDISERRNAQRRLERATRALRALSACNETLIRVDDESKLLSDVCSVAVEQGGYLMAWVGFAGYDEDKLVLPMAWAGHVDGYLDEARFSWGDDPLLNGPPGHAIRTGEPFLVRFVQTDPLFARWRAFAIPRGYRSVAALPLIDSSGERFGAMMFISGEEDSFDEEELVLLGELANDVAFGVDTLRGRRVRSQMEANLRRSNARLESVLFSLTESMGRVVEARDPYTQGHQERVAALAKAIAARMGLPGEDLEAVQVASMVHDVGKLAVPAEILTKPGRLTEIEFAIIKEHPSTGYQILKDIAFPWPVADIVHQHHERMDGSGYPAGLKGDEILTAARIIAVADVVEAMASHRPYRPALTIGDAMDELVASSEKYDPTVVHACLELFATGELELDESAAHQF